MYDPEGMARALADIERRLKRHNLTQVSRDTGIGRQTIIRFAHGQAKNPWPQTVWEIQRWLDKNEVAA